MTLPVLIDYASHNSLEAKIIIAGNLGQSVKKEWNSSTYRTHKKKLNNINNIIYVLTYPELADDNVVNDSLDLAPGVVVPALRKFKVRDA